MNNNDDYERVRKMIEETRLKCQETLSSCSNTISNLHTTQKTLVETRNNIDNFYDQFNDAMNKLCNNIAQSFGGAAHRFKKSEQTKDIPESKNSSVNECFEVLKDKKRIVFLTGAGISIASGIAGFRGIGAAELFQKDGVTYKNEEISTVAFMNSKPQLFWERNLQFIDSMKGKKYNLSHAKIQELMNVVAPEFTLVTQNIDGLHWQAFNELANQNSREAKNSIYEIHGNKNYIRCNNRACDQYEIPFTIPEKIGDFRELVCEKCKQLARPNVLYFDESYTETNYRTDSLKQELKLMDALICVGTMLETGFAASMVSNAIKDGIPVIEINLTPVCEVGALILKEKAEIVVPQLCDAIIKHNNKDKQQMPVQQNQQYNQKDEFKSIDPKKVQGPAQVKKMEVKKNPVILEADKGKKSVVVPKNTYKAPAVVQQKNKVSNSVVKQNKDLKK